VAEFDVIGRLDKGDDGEVAIAVDDTKDYIELKVRLRLGHSIGQRREPHRRIRRMLRLENE
jgi:hypothetical protein